MTEEDRILTLVEEGKITSEEADRLLAVLRDIDGVDREMGHLDAEIAAASDPHPQGNIEEGETPQRSPRAELIPSPEPNGAAEFSGNPRWIHLDMLAGDVTVMVDEDLDAPCLDGGEEGGMKLEKQGEDYYLSQFGGRSEGGFLERLMGGFRHNKLSLRIPQGFGVELSMKAGDVNLKGVPYLRGGLLAGDLDADALEGVDLTMSAGDVKLGLRPTSGSHRVVTTAGDVTIFLLPGSSARVEGGVNIGDISLTPPFERERQGLGQRFHGVVGGGDAELELKLSTGDLKVVVSDE